MKEFTIQVPDVGTVHISLSSNKVQPYRYHTLSHFFEEVFCYYCSQCWTRKNIIDFPELKCQDCFCPLSNDNVFVCNCNTIYKDWREAQFHLLFHLKKKKNCKKSVL